MKKVFEKPGMRVVRFDMEAVLAPSGIGQAKEKLQEEGYTADVFDLANIYWE